MATIGLRPETCEGKRRCKVCHKKAPVLKRGVCSGCRSTVALYRLVAGMPGRARVEK